MKLFLRLLMAGIGLAFVGALGTVALVKWLESANLRGEGEKLAEIVKTQREAITKLQADIQALETTARERDARLQVLEKATGGLAVVAGPAMACKVGAETALVAKTLAPNERVALETRYRPGPLRLSHTGQAIRLVPPPGGTLKIGNETAELVSLDIHRPEGGMFAGVASALVLHLVHRGEGGKPVVLSVPLRESAFQQRTLWQVAQHVPAAGAAEVEVPTVSVDPASLLPQSLSYDLYTGALPVPPCTAGARVLRLRNALGLSKEQVGQFQTLMAAAPAAAQAGVAGVPGVASATAASAPASAKAASGPAAKPGASAKPAVAAKAATPASAAKR